MHTVVPRRGPRSVALPLLLVTAALGALGTLGMVTACATADPDDPGVRAAAVYAEVVRWFAASSLDDPDPLPVFVEPRGEGSSIPLDVQAELLNDVREVADIRFIDARDEAVVVDDDGVTIVADDGILVRLSPVDEVSDPVLVDVDMYVAGDDMVTLQFRLDQVADGWAVSGSPEQVATPSLDPSDD